MSDEASPTPFQAPRRAGYGVRDARAAAGQAYRPRPLVRSSSPGLASGTRRPVRGGGSGKKDILCAIGVDVDAVAGWLRAHELVPSAYPLVTTPSLNPSAIIGIATFSERTCSQAVGQSTLERPEGNGTLVSPAYRAGAR